MFAHIAEAFHAGGWPMWPILGCSIFAIAIAIERYWVMMMAARVNKDNLLNQLNAYILQGNLDKALAVTAQAKSPLSNIVRAGLQSVLNNQTEEEVQTAMDSVALREIPLLERNINILAAISNMATLIGLLGTVIGMIGAFAAVASASPSEKATFLAAAIAEAMNCTAFGLIVAIPSLAAYIFFNNWSQRIVDDIHEASVTTLNFILTNREKLTKRKQVNG